MSDLSQILSGKGTPVTFEHDGKTYNVSYLTQKPKTAFETWVKKRAWEALFSKREFIEPERFAQEEEDLQTAMECGHYGYHGRICQATLSTECGQLAIAAILFGVSEDEMFMLAAERQEDVSRIVSQQIRASMPVVKKPVSEPVVPPVPVPGEVSTPAPVPTEASVPNA